MHNFLKAVCTASITSLLFVMTGCSSTNGMLSKVDNGSLEYQQSTLLQPLQIPTNVQAQPFVQLYPTVELGESQVVITNKSKKQYQLPAPERSMN